MPCLLRGIDHLYLSVRDPAVSEAWYDRLMQALGLHKGDRAIAGEPHAHYLAPTFQLTLRPARSAVSHDPYVAGLHHLCFQVESRETVDQCHALIGALGISVSGPRFYPEYNPEYYAIFFEDPDGIRLEIVARTSYRQALQARWNEFDRFLNPLQALPPRDAG